MEVTFMVEPFKEAFGEADALMAKHWEEIARNKHLLVLNPDVERYEIMEKKGDLLLVTARSAGALVGYFLWVLGTHSHYKDVLVAEEDLHYLTPECRLGLIGYNFMKFSRQAALDRGAKLLVVREKLGHEHPALMKRLGYMPTEIAYTYSAKEGV